MSRQNLANLDRDICQPLGRVLQEAFSDGVIREVDGSEIASGFLSFLKLESDNTVDTKVNLNGIIAFFQNDGIINHELAMVSALYARIRPGGTYTKLSHLSAIWADSGLAASSTVGTGESEFLYISNNGLATINQAIFVYGNHRISNFIRFETCTNNHMVEVKALSTQVQSIRCLVKDATGTHTLYIPLYSG